MLTPSTFLACAADGGTHVAPVWALAPIVGGYLVIAMQFWAQRGTGGDRDAKRALAFLVAIFVLCAWSGYVPSLLSGVGLVVEYPAWMHNTTHVVLMAATWGYITSDQAGAIARALRREHPGAS